MEESPNPPFEEPENLSPQPSKRSRRNWRWQLWGILFLSVVVPALVLLVFYYREVAVTYYMTRNPLQPSSLHMARTIEGVLIGDLRVLAGTGSAINWTLSPPSSANLEEEIGKSVQDGKPGSFSGWEVFDRTGNLMASVNGRNIDPYMDQARSVALELLRSNGMGRYRVLVVPGRTPLVFLLLAVRTGNGNPGSGGILVGIQNLSQEFLRYLPVPKISSSPGRAYLLSGDGVVLVSTDGTMVGKNLTDLDRKGVLDRFHVGKSGSFVRIVAGIPTLFGSSLLVDLTGVAPDNWFAVLEAPKSFVDAEANRIRLNMDLIVFLLVPAFMGIVLFLLYRSMRS